jgi:hypothetical protein
VVLDYQLSLVTLEFLLLMELQDQLQVDGLVEAAAEVESMVQVLQEDQVVADQEILHILELESQEL